MLAVDDLCIRTGRFTMVCRDAVTHKSRSVNPLILSTPEEKELHAIGEGKEATLGLENDAVS